LNNAQSEGLTIWDYKENKALKSYFSDQKIISIDISPDNKSLIIVKKGLMKKVLQLSLLLIIVISVIACSSGGNKYVDKQNGFAIKFPDNWVKENVPGAAIGMQDPALAAHVSILVQKLPANITLDLYEQKTSQAAQMAGIKRHQPESTTLCGLKAYKTKTDISAGGHNFTTYSYDVLKDGKLYSVLFTSSVDKYSSNQIVFNEMISSFECR